jgi:sugar phosphate isomerase/epimerase
LTHDAAKASSAADQLGWQMSIHAYTFRKFSIFECIDKTAALGLKHMSLSGSVNLNGSNSVTTVQLSEQDAEAIKKAAADKGIKLVNIGVVTLPPDEAKSRKVFEFAKKMGIDTLVAEPEPAALDTVEKLCKEYNIKVAIHNHPKPNHYWSPEIVLEAVNGRTTLMGACADTGHWLRSGLDPVECLKKLEGRVITLHFKDLVPDEPKAEAKAPATGKKKKQSESKAMHDVPWGTGVGHVKAQMAELKRQHFHGAFGVEYEYHWDNSMPEVAECVKFFNATCEELAKSP